MTQTPTTDRWIDLEGADNVRDLGGLVAGDGRTIRARRLIRSDSLNGLTDADVRHLVDDLQVTAVADLRTGVEVSGEGPSPMAHEDVEIRHLSLFPEPAQGVEVSSDQPVILPWNERDDRDVNGSSDAGVSGSGVSGIYLGYLEERSDSVLEALRLIAGTGGATIVHCAAGKDRTGTVIALVLAELGVATEDIVEDYTLSAERVEAILARLVTRRTYATDLVKDEPVDKHKPKPETMRRLLALMGERFGGVPAWLRAHGWTDADAAALRAKLLD